jgi:hypothetical protein
MNGVLQPKTIDPLVRKTLEKDTPIFLAAIDNILKTSSLSSQSFKQFSRPSEVFGEEDIIAKDFNGTYSVSMLTITPTAAILNHTTVYIEPLMQYRPPERTRLLKLSRWKFAPKESILTEVE